MTGKTRRKIARRRLGGVPISPFSVWPIIPLAEESWEELSPAALLCYAALLAEAERAGNFLVSGPIVAGMIRSPRELRAADILADAWVQWEQLPPKAILEELGRCIDAERARESRRLTSRWNAPGLRRLMTVRKRLLMTIALERKGRA